VDRENGAASGLVLSGRRSLSVSGVKEVSGFDDRQIEADTTAGELFVRGEELRILSFDRDSGDLELEGRIDGMAYAEKTEKRGLWARLFGG
jgi:sporulation protein YabP